MKHEERRWPRASARIRSDAIVGDSKLGELWKKADQVDSAPFVPLANRFLGNVVSASCGARTNACNVQFGGGERHVPHANLDAVDQRALEQRGHRVSAEGRLEREHQALLNGSFEKAFSFVPGCDVG